MSTFSLQLLRTISETYYKGTDIVNVGIGLHDSILQTPP